MIEKPVTTEFFAKAEKVWKYMRDGKTHTKEDISNFLGGINERSVRDIISFIATRHPVIATSDTKGYRLAMYKSDLDDVIHEWKELSHRIEEIEKRIKPLIRFKEKVEKGV